MLYKLLAVVSYMIVWALLYSIQSRIYVRTSGVSAPYVTILSLIEYPALYMRDFIFPLLSNLKYVSMIMLAWCASHIFTKYRQPAGLGIFILSGLFFNHLIGFIYNLLLPVISTFNMESGKNGVRYVQISISLITCMVLVFVGLYLYEWYSEV